MGFGELDKVEEEYKIGKGGGEFMNLEKGDNRVRIVSDFEPMAQHWGGKKPVVCIGRDKGCSFCNQAEPDKPNPRFLLWVIDRAETDPQAKFKKLGVGYTVIKALDDLRQDEDWKWGENGLPDYDVNIKKNVKGSGTNPSDTSYTVIGSPNKAPLTPEEQKAVAELKPIADTVNALKSKQLKDAVQEEVRPDEPPREDEVNVDDIPF